MKYYSDLRSGSQEQEIVELGTFYLLLDRLKKNFAKDLNYATLMSRKEESEPAAESSRGLHSGKQKDCGGLNMGR